MAPIVERLQIKANSSLRDSEGVLGLSFWDLEGVFLGISFFLDLEGILGLGIWDLRDLRCWNSEGVLSLIYRDLEGVLSLMFSESGGVIVLIFWDEGGGVLRDSETVLGLSLEIRRGS